ncbi:DNA polymerase III subunit gamma/tau [Sediminicurvatus halobius]|uniref:DNA polymerase III subunit gamma/tau n=1 Tax=Sediminicurvatus halobius TaxID=2182432 RepID=A0A2U2N406_9GAMM|nr:DNA polymerase III subunit gamma/tau [Spiribacter halobius]PWG63709.1 DNA polymerase III subunit gamma/tau [Spiribacter halobius]UEX79847.1 DNA polymerase III subunit gamma/tau [Spiribacter halobius]
MTYQVLARKWRPRSFAEMVGQSHVLRALGNGLANGRLHHAYLFTGTRGVGKTTVARILAKCLNCERDGVTAEPCGTCDACREIDQGRFVDLIEVDAASRTKVEDTRDLLDNVQYAPTRGRFKIYLVDEVHMLSAHSFNALLKTLEEPPPHVKFLLATTDPQKLPVTILSRCLQFNLKHLPATVIREQLARIAEAEGISAEPEALRRLARAADGSMRDALSLMDQAIAFGGGALGEDEVREMLGTLEQEFVLELLEALADQDGPALLAVVERMAERAPDFGDALAELLALLHQMSLAQHVPEAVAEDLPGRERLLALAERLAPEAVQLFYQIALTGRRDLPLAPDPRTGFEMTLLRMLAFEPAAVEPPVEHDGGTRARSPQTPQQAPAAPASTPASGARRATAHGAASASAAGGTATAVAERQGAPDPAAASPAEPAPAPSSAAADEPPPAAARDLPPSGPPVAERGPAGGEDGEGVDWHGLVARLRLGGMAHALASHCDWAGREGDRVRLRIDAGHAHLLNPSMQERLRAALARHFQAELQLSIDVGEVSAETPAEAQSRSSAARAEAAREAIERDPNVLALRETFGAEVIPDSIRPAD